jgi:nickel/cobalt transporter (NiCoT) family protein
MGVQVALTLAGFFAAGMIPIDTLDSIVLRSAFPRIFHTKAFRYMAYALSGAALGIAAIGSYFIITNSNISPRLTGPVLAVVIISFAFGYAFATRNRGSKMGLNRSYQTPNNMLWSTKLKILNHTIFVKEKPEH